MRADVQISHRLRATARRIQREAAGKTERVQHRLPVRQSFDDAAVLALIEKESRLLPAPDIGLEADVVFKKDNRSFRRCIVILRKQQFGFIGQTQIPARAQKNRFWIEPLFQQFTDFLDPLQPGRRVNLHHQRRVVAIQHQARPAIALAIDDAITRGFLIEQTFTAAERSIKPIAPEFRINRQRFADMQHAQADRRLRIKETDSEKFVVTIKDHSQFARFTVAILLTHAVGENPRMTGA